VGGKLVDGNKILTKAEEDSGKDDDDMNPALLLSGISDVLS